MQEHSVCIPSGKAVVQAATSPHAACIDVQAVPLQMHRPMQPGWLTPPDSNQPGVQGLLGERACGFQCWRCLPSAAAMQDEVDHRREERSGVCCASNACLLRTWLCWS